MRRHDPFCNRQPQARRSVALLTRRVTPVKPLKNMWQRIGRNTRARILDPEVNGSIKGIGRHRNCAANRSVAQRIAEQIAEHLRHTLGIHLNLRQIGSTSDDQVDPAFPGLGLVCGSGPFDQGLGRNRLTGEGELSSIRQRQRA